MCLGGGYLLVLGKGVTSDQLHDFREAVLLLQDVAAPRAELAVVVVVAVEEGLEHAHVPVFRGNTQGANRGFRRKGRGVGGATAGGA